MNDAPNLLVAWSSPWEEFRTAIRPALSRSPRRLAGEARTDLLPYRGMLASWAAEVVLLIAAIVLPGKFATMRPYEPPQLPKYDVIYFSGNELPQTEDAGGARAGRAGRAGGHQAHHNTQTIRVARGESVRERVVDAPRLKLPKSDQAVANLLAYKTIPGPAPAEGLKSSTRAPSLSEAAVPPTPEVQREQMRSAPMLNSLVVPPSPRAPQQAIAELRIPGSQIMAVVPPPVSAPEEITNSHPKLSLPAPSVIAPPPTNVARDVRSMGPGFGAGELQKQVVPPPVQMSGTSNERNNISGLGNATVVPPPVQFNGNSIGNRTVAALGTPNVVPPPVQVGSGSLNRQSPGSGLGGGTAVVAPPPTIAPGGLGSGRRGGGLGSAIDAGSLAAPPSTSGGTVSGTGIVVSNQPGSKVGVPGSGGAGSIAMSPAGGAKPGVGGSGGGAGIGHGDGPGSGLSGEGSGAAKEGSGRGADTVARAGISPYPGSGGAGSGPTSKPAMPGVSVHGGSHIVTLPSFGTNGSQPGDPTRSSAANTNHGPAITVVGSSRSGGALNFYGALKGDKVYTIYIDTALGTAVMEYADPASATHPYAEDLVAPQPMHADLPANLTRSRLIVACILDRSGMLRNPQVLEPGGREMTTKVVAALTNWKFRPVFRGGEPVEVNAILGFDIDTR